MIFFPLKRLLSGLMLLLVTISIPSVAQQRWYQVELLVFDRYSEANANLENWPQDIALSYPANLRGLKSAGQQDQFNDFASAWVKQPRAQLDLTKASQHLRYAKGYRVLWHNAWVQPFKKGAGGTPVAIHGGENYGEHRELEGFVRVRLGHYLHVETDLWFSRFNQQNGSENWPELPVLPWLQATDQNSDSLEQLASSFTQVPEPVPMATTGPRDFTVTMVQERRMRSRELHYLDHPLFGVLVLITPVPAPQA